MDIDALMANLTPDIYERLKRAVELGKWPDGVALTAEQRENCLQMVMLWQARHNHQPEHMSIGTDGQIVMKSKRQLLDELDGQPQPVARLKPQ
ncbi:YeaC family protein [Sodalis sp. RH21]|uniref:YeaC family protein n=1 Tax=unclassified Sodalis (in: enterobacteria) TaxID=2636512 RepID=UPI0039B66F3D